MNTVILGVLGSVGKVLGKVLLGMATSLMTEALMKKLIVMALEKMVAKTETEIDNQILLECKKAWFPEQNID